MSDETNVEINVSVNGDASVERAADRVAELRDNLKDAGVTINNAVKELDRLERGASGVAAAASKTAKSAKEADVATRGWAQSMAAVNKASMTAPQNNIYDTYMTAQKKYDSERDAAYKENAVRDKAAAAESSRLQSVRVNQAAAANKQMVADDAASRQRELSSLRSNIQERNRLEQQAASQRAAQNRQSLQQMAQDEAASRKQTLAALKADIISRNTPAAKSGVDQNLPALRYALYDISNALAVVGVSMVALTAAPYAMAISWERAFADVRRTVDGTTPQLDALEQSFVSLAQTIPVSFRDLSQIGSLAGQLNVPAGEIADFTELVAKFSATTDVTIDASATAFARLTQLLGPLEGGYESLGSAILKAGVNSIATESQIIAISTQIAGVASQAKLGADEVIALSTAMASLGIQPELARGTITRLFGNIGRAITAGGTALEDFGKISGISGQQFRDGWENDTMATLVGFLEGIGNKQGPAAEAALNALGISSVRDIPAILRLAQNTDLLNNALADTASQAENGTELNKQYGIIANTVAEKITLLGNNFQAFLATLGQSATGIGFIIDGLNSMLQAMTKIANDPFWSTIIAGGLALTAIGGVLAIVASVAVRSAGSVLALRFAMQQMGISTLGANASLASAIPLIMGTGTASNVAAGGLRVLGAAMKAVSVVGLAVMAVDLATQFANWGREAIGVTDSVTTLQNKLMELDTDLAKTFSSANYSGDMFGIGRAIGSDTAGLDAILVQGSNFGTEFAGAFNRSLLQQFSTGWLEDILGVNQGFNELDKIDEAIAGMFNTGNQVEAIAAYDALIARTEVLGGDTAILNTQLTQTNAAFGEGGVEAARSALSLEDQAAAAQIAAEMENLLAEEITNTISAFTDGITTSADLESALFSLGGTLAQGGDDLSQFSEAGRANLGALMQVINALAAQTPGDAAATANSMQGLFNSLVQGGYASAQQLAFLQNIIAGLGGASKPTTVNLGSLVQGMQKVQTAAAGKGGGGGGGAAKAVRTLLDYAKELGEVAGRAFEIRFSSQASIDKVTTQWMNLNEELAEYQLKVQKLTADRAITAYFLSVAEAYGDVLRAGKLRGELADIDGELADAQSVTNKTLIGNSKAAIANRKVVGDLVKGYQDYIQALAASGADQNTLRNAVANSKAEFYAQATALGFSSAELGTYAAGFDDLTYAINNVPRNITVSANTNPAVQALNEYLARVNASSASVGVSGYAINPGGVATAFKQGIEAQMRNAPVAINGYLIQGQQVYRVPGTSLKLYASGGAVDGPGSSTSDSIPARLSDGEFVMRASARSGIGDGMLNYMNRYGRLPGFGFASGGPVGQSTSNSNAGGMVALVPEDRALLRAWVNRPLIAQVEYVEVSRAAKRGDEMISAAGGR